MNPKDIFGDDTEEKKTFNPFEEHLNKKQIKSGDKVTGTILSITGDTVIVDINSYIDGILPKKDILTPEGQLKYQIGDQISCIVKRLNEENILLKLDGAKIRLTEMENLEDAFDHEIPVEGLVVEIVKGGFRILLPGSIKAFCPISQIDFRTQSPETYINKKFSFIITQFEVNGQNIIVSRKKALEIEKIEKEKKFLATIQYGDLLEGEITHIEKFGAFIYLNKWELEGLIPLSELSWNKIKSPETVVQIGDQVKVKFLSSKETESGKLLLSFSLKQADAEGNPWDQVSTKLKPGILIEGQIEKKENFGFFIQLYPGVNGLLPKSLYQDLPEHREIEQLKKGDKILVTVQDINYDNKKILLNIPKENNNPDELLDLNILNNKKMATLGDFFKKNN